MNSLNSVLIEGILVMNPEYVGVGNTIISGAFTIASTRYLKKNNEVEKETRFFNIIMNGNLAVNMKKIIFIENSVRVVGRLSQNEDGDIIIIAEHIEIKNRGA